MNQVVNQHLAPDYRPLLGKPDAGVAEQVTPLGIHYQPNGFDRWRRKWVMKRTPNFLREQGAAHLIDQFQIEAEYIKAVGIAKIIDDAYTTIRAKWLTCGGKYAEAANTTKPKVIIEPKPFFVPEHNLFANGVATDKEIRVVVMGSRLLYNDPRNASIVSMKSLLLFEFGNAFEYALNDGRPINVDEEIGDASPCQRIR
jgi:hypothetical protein